MAYQILKTSNVPVRGVLFDLDGVVIDMEKLYTRFWVEAANELGWPMTREQALQLRSLGRGPGQIKLEAFFGPEVRYDTVRARRIERMDAYIAEHGVEEKPGIRELLALLKEKNIPCAITSSSAIPVIRQHLGSLGLLESFTALCSGKDVPRGKPAPDIYLHGAAALGLEPEACLAIEDSPAGIEAAWRAGCKAVIVPDQDQPTDEVLERCFARADSLLDVRKWLEGDPLSEILTAVRRWLGGVQIPARVLTDRPDALRVIFETDNALAELLTGEGEYAPYRFVSFTVLDTRPDLTAAPVFCFCDNEAHTAADILRELDRGLAAIADLT